MFSEQPRKYTKEEIKKIKIQKGIDKLRKTGEKFGDSDLYDLAESENKFRNKMGEKGVTRESANELADDFSDETLGRMEAEEESLIDPLTGLKNRRAMDEEVLRELSLLKREIILSERRKRMDCSVLMIDADNFKIINDTYGHPFGDKVLIGLANIIRSMIRKEDFVCRYGGEEFVIFLPDTGIAEAMVFAERLRKRVNETGISFSLDDESAEVFFMVSIGGTPVSEISDWKKKKVDDIKDELIRRADVAMYEAKKLGRNIVKIYNPSMGGENK